MFSEGFPRQQKYESEILLPWGSGNDFISGPLQRHRLVIVTPLLLLLPANWKKASRCQGFSCSPVRLGWWQSSHAKPRSQKTQCACCICLARSSQYLSAQQARLRHRIRASSAMVGASEEEHTLSKLTVDAFHERDLNMNLTRTMQKGTGVCRLLGTLKAS